MEHEISGLADAALDFFLLHIEESDAILDLDYKCRVLESIDEYFKDMSPSDFTLIMRATAQRLARIHQGPDEYGYNPGLRVDKSTVAFLEAVASGEIFDQWCK